MNLLNEQYAAAKSYMQKLLKDEEGIGTVEMVIIIFVLIGLAVLFKDQASALITKYFGTMGQQIDGNLLVK